MSDLTRVFEAVDVLIEAARKTAAQARPQQPQQPQQSTQEEGLKNNMAIKPMNGTKATTKKDEGEDFDTKFSNVGFLQEGTKIVLPDGMTEQEGIVWLNRKIEADGQTVAINEIVNAYPLDGAYALVKAIERTYGFANLVTTPGFWGPQPPTMVGVEVAPNKTIQVPWGRIQVPGLDGWISAGFELREGRMLFRLQGQVPRRSEKNVSEIAHMIREIVSKESIYRGKAIHVEFPDYSEEANYNPTLAPRFLDTSGTKEEELVLPVKTQQMIDHSLFTPIMYTEACKTAGIPLKRGILLSGPYGVGKTMTAHVTAKKCQEHGWTYIHISSSKDLRQALLLAMQYQPAVVFAEDVDRAISGEERSDEMDEILNTLDGVETKGASIITVLTTNNVQRINRAMLRPGRLDAVITVNPPDAQAVERLVRTYARHLLSPVEPIHEVGRKLAGQIPSVIREVVERSKLAAIHRSKVKQTLNSDGMPISSDDMEVHIVEQDLVAAAEGMLSHMELLREKVEDVRSPQEKAMAVLVEGLKSIASNAGGIPAHQVVTVAGAVAPTLIEEETDTPSPKSAD